MVASNISSHPTRPTRATRLGPVIRTWPALYTRICKIPPTYTRQGAMVRRPRRSGSSVLALMRQLVVTKWNDAWRRYSRYLGGRYHEAASCEADSDPFQKTV